MIGHALLVERHADVHDDTTENLTARGLHDRKTAPVVCFQAQMPVIEDDLLEFGIASGEFAIFLA